MKYFKDYTEEPQTILFKNTGLIFAFSMEQFNAEKVEGIKYVNLGHGMICPKENVETLTEGLEKIKIEGVKQDIEENGKEAIIKRELWNHEAFYTYELDDTLESLKKYGFTYEDVQAVFNVEKHNADC
jgi:hypothetical protein